MTRRADQSILITLLAILTTGLLASEAQGQTLRLRQAGTNATRVDVQVGQAINIEVVADLQGVASAGIAFFITVPSGAFLVSDQGLAGQAGNQPFRVPPNSLFAAGVTASNLLLLETDEVAAATPGQQLDYSAVIGLGSDRERTGSGVVATFQIVAIQPIENGSIRIDDNPVRETKLVLADGISDRRFVTTQGMEITVNGLELLDIPDVILQPGESDSVQIGTLDQYLINTRSPADSIRWSFEPANHDSVEISVDPFTRIVKVVPQADWRGSVRLVWTATDPQRPSPGQPFLSATEVSIIVVNNRPSFDLAPDENGIKRYAVRLLEDRNTFIPGINTPDERKAFRDIDLDEIVFDPDIVADPDLELNYAVSSLPPGTSLNDVNVRGLASATHDLLVWSRPDYGGTDSLGVRFNGTDTVTVRGGIDSLRVIVQDRFGGRDTMRVMVEVEEVIDAPRIIETETNPSMTRGGTKIYPLSTFVEDPDTPLEDLIITWVDDPDRFTVDTLRSASGELLIRVTNDPSFLGSGRVVITVADPLDPDVLQDQETFFFTSSPIAGPEVGPPDNIKVPTEPGGLWTTLLDDHVEDPDNDDSELRWFVPPGARSNLGVDAERVFTVNPPDDYHGYEQVELTVTDPGGLADVLTLRIYSSDGRPVTGGIPDLILDRGTQHQFDLDEYYHDSNNSHEQMAWREQPTFDPDNISISVDPLTHIVTYAVSDNASFGAETVIFRVTDTDGVSHQDTMVVTIRSGPESNGAFRITPALPPLQAVVGQAEQVITNLNDFIVTTPEVPRSSITWELVRQTGNNGIAGVGRRPDATDADGVRWTLTVLGETSGVDTLQFVATDSLGRTETATTTIRYFGESEKLELRSIPDIVFVAGTFFDGLLLNDFILDRETHPDSLVTWTHLEIGSADGGIIIEISDDSSVRTLAFDPAETEVVFTARNDSLGVTGRDTVRVIVLPEGPPRELQPMPDLRIQAGGVDSSLVLNDFLPDDLSSSQTNWSVSGARITNPVIDPLTPHRLRVSSIGTSVGTDTLDFRVDLGGGIVATGQLQVKVEEPIDESTLSLQVVPNPLNTSFLDFFVMARTDLTSSPTVVVTFEGDTTVAVRQIEDDLQNRDVLIWAGSFRVRAGATGTLLFRAQAITALGSSVSAQESITLATAVSGKPLALHHGAIEVLIPADAVAAGQMLILRADGGEQTHHPAARRASADELMLQHELQLWPAGLPLAGGARVILQDDAPDGAGFYRSIDGAWRWMSTIDVAQITQLGRYGVLIDRTAPALKVHPSEDGQLRVTAADGGSGIAADGVFAIVDGQRFLATPDRAADGSTSADVWSTVITVTDPALAGPRPVLFVARDRAGNEVRRSVVVTLSSRMPRELQLGANYPNPFNPETTIPLQVSVGARAGLRLRVYNAAGQVVRELLANTTEALEPGRHEVRWDGLDDQGRQVSSGVYFYRLESTDLLLTRSMTMLK